MLAQPICDDVFDGEILWGLVFKKSSAWNWADLASFILRLSFCLRRTCKGIHFFSFSFFFKTQRRRSLQIILIPIFLHAPRANSLSISTAYKKHIKLCPHIILQPAYLICSDGMDRQAIVVCCSSDSRVEQLRWRAWPVPDLSRWELTALS